MKHKLLLTKGRKLLLLVALAIIISFPTTETKAQTITNNTQGTHDGFFYSFWNDGQRGSASMTLGAAGNYTTTWNNINNFTAGKGWKTGKADRAVCFEGTYDGGSNGFLAVYGWTKEPLIEYYVVESYGNWTPPGNTSDIIKKGSFTSDGGTYNIFVSTRTDKPSIVGTATFQQFWSVRTTKRSSGTVTFSNHIAEWKRLGMNMGTVWDYQIMESEGYQSTGSSNITVRECVSCNATAPTVTAKINYEQGDAASKLTASGTNLKWYSSASSTTPLASAPTPSTANTGTISYFVSQTPGNCESPRAEIVVTVANTYKIFKVLYPIAIDGIVDAVWDNSNVVPMNATKLLQGTVANASDLSGYAKVLWDNEYLYLLATVIDDDQVNDSDPAYEDDGVELYIDINNDKATTYGANDVQYTFNWNNGTTVGTLPAARPSTNITYVSVNTTNGYRIEAKIPWSTLQGNPKAADLIGLDFMINDDDASGTRDGKLSWNAAEDDAWQNPSLFGRAVLVENELVTATDGISETSISIHPNPTKDVLVINGFEGAFQYSMIDNMGRTLQSGESTNTVDISAIENGLYHLVLKQGAFQKIVKVMKTK